MGQRIECSIRIMAPRPVVWAMIHDSPRQAEWAPWILDSRPLTPGVMRRGSRLRASYKWLRVRSWLELEYFVWNPPERSASRTERTGPGSLLRALDGSWQLHDNGDGTTGWTIVQTVRLGGGPLGFLIERVFARGYLRRSIERSQQNLKRLVEAEYEPPPVAVPPVRTRLTGPFWQTRIDHA